MGEGVRRRRVKGRVLWIEGGCLGCPVCRVCDVMEGVEERREDGGGG
jgi:hypothetical protein